MQPRTANLLKFQEEVEDTAGAAVKELQIEVKLAQIVEQWEEMNLSFADYKTRGPVLLMGVADILEATKSLLSILRRKNMIRNTSCDIDHSIVRWQIQWSMYMHR